MAASGDSNESTGPVGDVEDQGDDMSIVGSGENKSVNAFDLINMCSGNAIGKMFQSDDEKLLQKTVIVPSPKPMKDIMRILMDKFPKVAGFQEQSLYKDDSKLRAIFDLGKGHVHIKVNVKVAAENPRLSMIVFKRARGDLISFGKVWGEVGDLAVLLK